MDPVIISAIVLFAIALVLLLHHGCHHSVDREGSSAKRESCWYVCYFQPKDIGHWESWSLICLTNSLTIGVLGPYAAGIDQVSINDVHVLLAVELFILGVIFLNVGSVWGVCAESPAEGRERSGLKLHNICNHETWILVAFTNGLSFLAF
jgi:hypothetical protein